ncbi:MAG: PIN domain-containing protein [Hyphomicrobiales bacterium]|nr:PIN domain-containing protein [Hyphomicrobiales bacterium]
MIYVDTSVVLARLFAEDRRPRETLWDDDLVSSRLLAYEIFNRLNARGAGVEALAAARALVGRIRLAAMSEAMLSDAMGPLPLAPRTLDALHLATMTALRRAGLALRFATFDDRFAAAAKALGFEDEAI